MKRTLPQRILILFESVGAAVLVVAFFASLIDFRAGLFLMGAAVATGLAGFVFSIVARLFR